MPGQVSLLEVLQGGAFPPLRRDPVAGGWPQQASEGHTPTQPPPLEQLGSLRYLVLVQARGPGQFWGARKRGLENLVVHVDPNGDTLCRPPGYVRLIRRPKKPAGQTV